MIFIPVSFESDICTVSQKIPTFKLSVTLSNLNWFSKFLHCWKAYEICHKIHTILYPPHLRHVAIHYLKVLEIRIFFRYSEYMKENANKYSIFIASNFVVNPHLLIFSVLKIASFSPILIANKTLAMSPPLSWPSLRQCIIHSVIATIHLAPDKHRGECNVMHCPISAACLFSNSL